VSRVYRCLLVLFILMCTGFVSMGQNKDEGINWPSFRGPYARGFVEGSPLPVSWNREAGENILWTTLIPGLAHSSPIIWGDRLFVTTAVSENESPELKTGLYGSVTPVYDNSVQTWKVFCLDKNSGEILWEKTAYEGVPKVKRHPMATHANSTAATDGQHVVAFFGSEGLYCYDMEGELLWKKNFGLLDSAFFTMPTAQWGFASSPVIHKGVVVVQCDALNTAFLAALDAATGKELWRTPREDYPTWSTPTIYVGEQNTQIIVNGFKHIGSYDFRTGKEIWKISGGGDIPIPTPVVAGDLVYINGAHGRLSPIYAIKLDAKGDISLDADTTTSDKIVWSVKRGGAYIPSPLVYDGYLYNMNWNGLLNCFDAKTGESVYKEQLAKMEAFAASGVASGGNLYFTSEEGNVYGCQRRPGVRDPLRPIP